MFHIIDDEAMLREVSETILTDYGYDVLCFESGNQYLEYLKSPNFAKPTAVLSDVTMPGINGYDLALEIRKMLPFQKIILITGNPDFRHHKEAAQQVCYTLSKPFNPEKFIAMVASITACHQLHQTDKQHAYPQVCSIDSLFHCPFACHQ
ncbi:MAG: nitrogen fixation protein FixJ [Proteobacteria bacterium]|nr:MAG: nitrogen fixation protein FixJ [Pseudomonadota bacterium]